MSGMRHRWVVRRGNDRIDRGQMHTAGMDDLVSCMTAVPGNQDDSAGMAASAGRIESSELRVGGDAW
jgi:hypothetical protein